MAFLSHVTSHTVIQFLLSVFSREGNPKELVSDNGSPFVSWGFKAFLEDRGITHRKLSVYARENCEVEHFNHSLKDSLQTVLLKGQPWKELTRVSMCLSHDTPLYNPMLTCRTVTWQTHAHQSPCGRMSTSTMTFTVPTARCLQGRG